MVMEVVAVGKVEEVRLLRMIRLQEQFLRALLLLVQALDFLLLEAQEVLVVVRADLRIRAVLLMTPLLRYVPLVVLESVVVVLLVQLSAVELPVWLSVRRLLVGSEVVRLPRNLFLPLLQSVL
jgi:hypothetical protein